MKSPIEIQDLSLDNTGYAEFNKRTDVFVAKMLSDYTPTNYREIKVIHDPVWGTMKFYPWELQILDSPLLQRLRNINQLGLVVLTYPSAHHSRFEHTLGVTALISKMVDSINDGYRPELCSENDRIIGFADVHKLRLAALLHDIGHCFFSHLSEKMYSETEEFTVLKNSFEIFKNAQPHEIMGYVVINTKAFKNFFKSSIAYPDTFQSDVDVDIFFDDIGRMIVGAPIEKLYNVNGKMVCKNYMTEMINGQFDADALDYLRRDSYITGLSLTYHIDRFLYKIKLIDRTETINGEEVVCRHLTVPISGVSTVEEMIFGKQMLTRYVYQHQKVLAADALVYDIVGGLKANNKLGHPCDYLYYCDDDIYKIYDESGDSDLRVPAFYMQVHKDSTKKISDVVKQIKMRDLPKKALVINVSNIASINGKKDFSLIEAYETVKSVMLGGGFRKEVLKRARKLRKENNGDAEDIDLFDIFYSVPKPVTTKNYTDLTVVTDDDRFVELSEVANLNRWAGEFSGRVWNSYVFCSARFVPVVHLAAKSVLEENGVEFFSERLYDGLKHHEKIERLLK